jgi:acylphosphatase
MINQPKDDRVSDDHQRLHAIVHGRVQGVSFRYYTVEAAQRHHVTGWVRNLPDETVEVTAEGLRPNLDQFLAFLHHGPSGAYVTQVDVQWGRATGQFKEFRVTY